MKLIRIYLIIGLMAVSLFGIVGVQVNQILNAMALNENNFKASVNDALNQVVQDLEGAEMMTSIVRVSRELDLYTDHPFRTPEDDERVSITLLMPPEGEPQGFRRQKVKIRDSLAIITEKEAFISMDSGMWAGGPASQLWVGDGMTNDSIQSTFRFHGHPDMVKIVQRTLDNLSSVNMNIEDRIDSVQVDTLLGEALLNQGIGQQFHFLVMTQGDEIVFMSEDSEGQHFYQENHKVRLFPHMESDRSYLYVSFPDRTFHALTSIWVEALASLIFSGIILFCFWLTIRTIIRQKELSEMKNDFINNMTHELKTPIATISLAADALNNPRMAGSQEGIARYTRIIKEENQRMHKQVERVLQAARFQRKEIVLNKVDVDAHQLIQQALHSIDLQVQQRKGEIHLRLDASETVLHGDQQHISNMIHNLLDNALKYSQEQPFILIRTYNEEEQFVIEVIDRGQGISKTDQARIFDRFFRVSTGNLHEIKGFGLGLSYVKEMADAHEGSVSVQSVLGKGSTFTIKLPIS
ncbi:MAG: HAMP domain-containing sensor histidine kinase [Bacteroidota bacterium]